MVLAFRFIGVKSVRVFKKTIGVGWDEREFDVTD